jgi:two-component system, chemotaxis family, response regulator WspR
VITLLVDNDELDVELTAFALRPHPEIELHHSARAEDAVAQALLVQPTVILQDLGMRERTEGLSLISKFRSVKETHDIPIIVYSGWNDPRVISTAFHVGADDFLSKPADPVELVARLLPIRQFPSTSTTFGDGDPAARQRLATG